MATLNRMYKRIKSSYLTMSLFFILVLILIVFDFPGGSLIALALWFQLYLKATHLEISKKSQLWAFMVFICSIPLLLFWGGVHSFMLLHFKEQNWLFFIFSLTLNFCLIVIASIQLIQPFFVAKEAQFKIDKTFILSARKAAMVKKSFALQTLLLLLISLIPLFSVDWRITLSVILTQLLIYRLLQEKLALD